MSHITQKSISAFWKILYFFRIRESTNIIREKAEIFQYMFWRTEFLGTFLRNDFLVEIFRTRIISLSGHSNFDILSAKSLKCFIREFRERFIDLFILLILIKNSKKLEVQIFLVVKIKLSKISLKTENFRKNK